MRGKWAKITAVATVTYLAALCSEADLLTGLEARAGIEPAHKGFADLSLTTWVPRLDTSTVARYSLEIQPSRFPRWIEIIADTGSQR